MEFIKVEEFLKQPIEVKKVLLEWWKPSKGDLYCNIYNSQQDNILVINDCQLEVFKTFKDDIKQYGCPLLTEGQLRQFIEDKVGNKITDVIYYKTSKQWTIFAETHMFKTDKEDLLQAYWKAALEIAKEK